MSGAERTVTLRAMTDADVRRVVAIQEPASIVALGSVFPQAEFPFPRDDVARRWLEEIGTPGIDCHIVVVNGEALVVGVAAIRGDEMLHFGIAVEHWGSGIAQQAHSAVIDRMRRSRDDTITGPCSGASTPGSRPSWLPTGSEA